MLLSEAIRGIMIYKRGEGLSQYTIANHRQNFNHMLDYLGDLPVEQITLTDLSRFMGYLQYERVPQRLNGDTRPYSQSHLRNHWKAIRSLFGYLEYVTGLPRPDIKLPAPKDVTVTVTPFNENEFKALINACSYSKLIEPKNRTAFRTKRPTARRDRALLFLMIDTGLRVGEIVRLRIGDVDVDTGLLHVQPFGAGIKSKSRDVKLGRVALNEVYLS